eukprot:NODE_112_length_18534_cov_1.163656.p16 type:complete len:133 gc:universal NODE_112_length_18534_cov_1.163656:16309-15911(-)
MVHLHTPVTIKLLVTQECRRDTNKMMQVCHIFTLIHLLVKKDYVWYTTVILWIIVNIQAILSREHSEMASIIMFKNNLPLVIWIMKQIAKMDIVITGMYKPPIKQNVKHPDIVIEAVRNVNLLQIIINNLHV